MKTLLLLSFLTQFGLMHAVAQDRKENKDKGQGRTEYFKNLSEKQEVNSAVLLRIFSFKTGDKVSINLSDSLVLRGVVLEKVTQPSGAVSVNIQSSEYPGLLFNFSKAASNQGQQIRARVIGRNTSEALVLVKENNRYYLRQTAKDKLIAE